MASIGGVGGGASDLVGMMNSLRGAGGGAGMGAAGDKFGSALEGALRGDVSGTMDQLKQLTSTDPTTLGADGVLAEAERAGARRSVMSSGGAGSVASLVESMNKAVQNRLESTEAAKKSAEADVQTLVSGGDIDLHNVILASERAGLEMKLTMTLRNKLIEAYQEVMRIPV